MCSKKISYEELEIENKILKEKLNKILLEENFGNIEHEERYRLISSISHDYTFSSVVLPNNRLKLNWVSGAFEKITGYSIDEYIKAGGWRSRLHPEDIEIDKRDMQLLYQNKTINTQLRTLNKKNEIVWVQVFAYPIWNNELNKLQGIYGTVRDINEKKKAEEELKVSEEKYRTLVDSAPDSIFIIINGKIEFVNQILLNLSGYKYEELIGQNFINFVVEKDREKVISYYLQRMKGDNAPFKYRSDALLKNGNELPVEVLTSVFSYFGQKAELVFLRDISKDIESEKALKDSENKYKNLLDFAPDAFFQGDRNGNFITINKKAIEMTGYTKEELLCMNVVELFSKDSLTNNPLRFDLLEDGRSILNEREIVRKNGEKIYVEMISKKMPNNTYQAFIRDITTKKIAEQQLIDSEQKFKLTFTTSPDAVNINKIDGTYVEVNKGFTILTGYSEEEVIGKTSLELKIWTTYEHRIELIEELKSKGIVTNLETQITRKDESIRTVLVSASLININGEDHIISITKDISERKKLENDLRKSKELAEESDRIKSSFLATMSHELRTPLNAVIGFSEIISRDTPIDRVIEMTRIINESGNQLLHIIESIFDLSLLQSKVAKVYNESFYISELHTKLEYYTKAEQKKLNKNHLNVVSHFNIEIGLKKLYTDKTRLTQLCSNLINNALKYTEKGFVKYQFLVENSDIKFIVEDSGIGIPEDKKRVIFDRFTQLENSHSRTQGGVGLGLSICKEILELFGGEIFLESEVNKGSKFTFIIPNIIETNISKSESFSKKDELQFIYKKNILVVEDVDTNYYLIKEILKNSNSNIIWAKTGEEAIEHVQKIPDLEIVLMDIRMPGINGFEATKIIKSIRPDLIIIAQTAYALNNEKELCKEAGCDGYISKPFKKSDLIKIIKEAELK